MEKIKANSAFQGIYDTADDEVVVIRSTRKHSRESILTVHKAKVDGYFIS